MNNYDTYKVIRNRVRKRSPKSIIYKCISKLHEISTVPIQMNKGYIPWEILLLIKIAFLEDGNQDNDRIATDSDIGAMLNIIKEENKTNKFLDEKTINGVYKFLRMLAFQQFWLQEKVSGVDIGRQVILFDSSDWEYPIKEKFTSFTNIELNSYFELLIATWAAFGVDSKKLFIDSNWFSPFKSTYKPDIIDNFLYHISLSYNGTKEYMTNDFKETNDFREMYYEQTPLIRYPLLNMDGKYYCYSERVLSEKIKNFVYDTMKTNDPIDFPREFGNKFEKYVDKCLKYTSVSFFNGLDMAHMFPGKKISDFLLTLDECTVIIEAKGIEMSPVVRVNPTNEELSRMLYSSVIKAIKQIYSMVKNLSSAEGEGISRSKNIFAVILTYKELYLGTGKDAWDEFIYSEVKEYIEAEGIDLTIILPENIYFVSIESFERLVYLCKDNDSMWYKVFSKAVKDNSDNSTKKFSFDLHMQQYATNPLPYIKEATDNLFKNVKIKAFGKA